MLLSIFLPCTCQEGLGQCDVPWPEENEERHTITGHLCHTGLFCRLSTSRTPQSRQCGGGRWWPPAISIGADLLFYFPFLWDDRCSVNKSLDDMKKHVTQWGHDVFLLFLDNRDEQCKCRLMVLKQFIFLIWRFSALCLLVSLVVIIWLFTMSVLTSRDKFCMLLPPPETVQNRQTINWKVKWQQNNQKHKYKQTLTHNQTRRREAAQTHKLKDWESVKAARNHILIILFILSGHVSPLSQSLTQRSHCDMSNLFWPENRKKRKPSMWS